MKLELNDKIFETAIYLKFLPSCSEDPGIFDMLVIWNICLARLGAASTASLRKGSCDLPTTSGKRALTSAHTQSVGPEATGTNVFQAMFQSCFVVNPPYTPPSLPFWDGNVYSIPCHLGNT